MSEVIVTVAQEHVDIPALVSTSQYPSLLVCAAQWSALLESTPVSLVRLEEDGGLVASPVDTSALPQSASGVLAPSVELEHVALDLPSEHVTIDLTLVNERYLESGGAIAVAVAPQTVQTRDRLQQVPSNMDRSSGEQLPTIMEDRSSSTSVLEDRAPVSLVPSTVTNEVLSESPAFRTRFLPTHIRNASETPSLPPFHSSSTSSAYHSRNSSFGSQISSCFESDSCLNQAQLTDVDSCIALHSGESYGDKTFLRLPSDARSWGKTCDGCYSSDLNLYCHMSSPLRAKEGTLTPLLLTPDHLDDTLRAGRVPRLSLEERQKAAGVKSAEWIRKEMEEGEGVTQVKVSSKQVHVVPFSVKAGSTIIWEFATKKRDIAFGVSFEPTEVVIDPLPSQEPLHKLVPILPTLRISSHAHPTVGYHTAKQDGIYEIIWDNSYSRFFAKDLFYRITTQPES